MLLWKMEGKIDDSKIFAMAQKMKLYAFLQLRRVKILVVPWVVISSLNSTNAKLYARL